MEHAENVHISIVLHEVGDAEMPGQDDPGYLGHDRMRRPISSFEMVRLASESARPRSIP